MSDAALTGLTGLAMLAGLVGIFIPVMPDVGLLWLAALSYGLLVEWGRWGPWLFALISLLGLLAAVVEVVGSAAGARLGGVSIWGILGGLGLGLIGLIFFTPIGGLVGLLVGTFLVEFYRSKDHQLALRGTLGMGLGYGASVVIKFLLGLGMVAAWVAWVLMD